ncbi:MAG: winged helix DNA-binding protein [Candidatus Kapabacteria bacterium]|nr:winged helix DNA-binding protein [Candidatus Kapabacteria bacterium]MDW8011864.1 S24 family peptidase [Bacteroidota bacterium]
MAERGTGLSRRQLQALRCIAESIAERGFPPTIQELCHALGCRSTNAVYGLLKALEAKGYLRRLARGRARSLQLTERALGGTGLYSQKHHGRVVPVLRSGVVLDPAEVFRVPVGYVFLDPLVFPEEELFALTVPDSALQGAGILSGDIVIAVRSRELVPGRLIVAWVSSTLLVRFLYQTPRGWELQASERSVPPLRFHASDQDVVVVGRVIGLLRRFTQG